MSILNKIKKYLKNIKTKPYNIFNTKYIQDKMVKVMYKSDGMNIYKIDNTLYIQCGRTTLKVIRKDQKGVNILISAIFDYLEMDETEYIMFEQCYLYIEGELNEAFHNAIYRFMKETKLGDDFIKSLVRNQYLFESKIDKYSEYYEKQFIQMFLDKEHAEKSNTEQTNRLKELLSVNTDEINKKLEKLKELPDDARVFRLKNKMNK